MVRENDHNIDKDTIKAKQAVSSDYKNTGCDRGHLNPNFFQYKEGRYATFTLTNAAPMVPRFNRKHWCKWERNLKSFLKNLNSDGKAYIVTGTVPNANVRMQPRGKPEDSNRVTVPSHVWTAVCYKHSRDDRESFSFGYIGQNNLTANINLMNVSVLNDQLSQLYTKLITTPQSIRIFHNDCFEDNYKKSEAKLKKAFSKSINLPLNPGVDDCLKTNDGKRIRNLEYEFRKRYASGQSEFESLLVPEEQKTAADGCLGDPEGCDNCQSDEGDEPYFSSPCLYQDKLKGY